MAQKRESVYARVIETREPERVSLEKKTLKGLKEPIDEFKDSRITVSDYFEPVFNTRKFLLPLFSLLG